jgi:hypothetical protein
MKKSILPIVFLFVGTLNASNAVFLVPAALVTPGLGTWNIGVCQLVFGTPKNYIPDETITSPPFGDLVKAMELNLDTAALVREAMHYHDKVPFSDVRVRLSDWRDACDTSPLNY